MASCVICHRLDRGFASPRGQYCSMDCMNAVEPKGAYWPYDEVNEKVKLLIKKPLSEYTYEEALYLGGQIIVLFSDECRFRATGTDRRTLAERFFHDESKFIEEAVKNADPNNLVRSVVDRFIEECKNDCPF